MVHALKEAWRVLVPRGTIIDVRPLSLIFPLEVVHDGVRITAGNADMTPDLKIDIAADQAVDQALKEGVITLASLETFDYVYYWKTYHGMVADFNERWQGEIIVSIEVLERAKSTYKQFYPRARLRLPMRMKLGKYLKA